MVNAPPLPAAEDVELLVDGARYGDLDDVTAALDNGVAVDAVDEHGRTALHMASGNGHMEVVTALLARGADAGAVNGEGSTPLHWACLNGHEAVVSALLEDSASPSALNTQERTPIDEALGRDGPSRDRLLALIDRHMQRRGAGTAQGSSVGSEFGDAGMADGSDTQQGGGSSRSRQDEEDEEFSFVSKPPAISSHPSP